MPSATQALSLPNVQPEHFNERYRGKPIIDDAGMVIGKVAEILVAGGDQPFIRGIKTDNGSYIDVMQRGIRCISLEGDCVKVIKSVD